MSQGKDVNTQTRTICPECKFNPICRQRCICTSSIFPVLPLLLLFSLSLLPLCLFHPLGPFLGTLSPPSDRHTAPVIGWLLEGGRGLQPCPSCLSHGGISIVVSFANSSQPRWAR